ncbi:MAG: hypothetical protein ACP5LO_04320 [Calditerrivibrio sp.]|uniref:hypothetical protein n=1 Tax=Calditerrivibrio sp. TaxID=2792612 RepID=UPI003D0EB1E6
MGVANSSNPKEINIAGHVSDLFASYAVSGTFRVAKSGGVRNLLLIKAGIPEEWRNLNFDKYKDFTNDEILKELRIKYQKRRGYLDNLGWNRFIKTFEEKLNKRKPPVAIYGLGEEKGMGDYFMEYAQGGIGIVLNIFNHEYPMGYYICSGMTAGAAYIRGKIRDEQLGVGVKKIDYLTEEDKRFLKNEIKAFLDQFLNIEIDKNYDRRLKIFAELYEKDPEYILSEFCKVIPLN